MSAEPPPLPAAPTPAPPPGEPDTPAPPPPAPRTYPFAFTGSWREYFRIWLVNLFLSIITVGLYSPWAKVRKKRYFYGNTWVADANFDYHGNPVAILKGRLLAVLAVVAYNLAGHYLPRLGAGLVLVLMIGAPWLISRSLRFNAVNSSYRNLRFHFHGGYLEGLRAIAPFLLMPAAALALPAVEPGQPPEGPLAIAGMLVPPLVLGIFYPYVVAAIKRYQVRRAAYGSAPFGFDARTRTFYGIYFVAGLLFTGVMTVTGVTATALMAYTMQAWVVLPLAYLLAGGLGLAFTRAKVGNLTFNRSVLDDRVRFASTLSVPRLARLYIGNLFAIVLTLGLAVPWAVMRTAQYRASCLRLECDGDLEGFLGAVARPVGAAGEQMGEFFDVDLSL